MNNWPFRRQVYLPQAIIHASRIYGPATGFRGVRAFRGRIELADALTLLVLAWALRGDGPLAWERVALLLGVLRLCRSTTVERFWARRF